jgi:tRNA(Arg) A34 adenosine deaminase TadA
MNRDPDLERLARNTRSLLREQARLVKPGSRNEYLLILLAGALEACERGDYPIGAVAAVRYQDIEVLSVGVNSLFSRVDPRGHAEANALARLAGLAHSEDSRDGVPLLKWPGVARLLQSAEGVYCRRIEWLEDQASSILYTSLEPCPMCTVILLNAGVHRVVVAERDQLAGALSSKGVHHMPPLWIDMAKGQGIQVHYIHPTLGSNAISSLVVARVTELFEAARPHLDQNLSTGGLLARADVAARIQKAVDAVAETTGRHSRVANA